MCGVLTDGMDFRETTIHVHCRHIRDYLWHMRMKEPVVTRKALLRSVKELPEQVPVDELIDRILLLSKIERGLAQSAKGEVVPTAEARKRLRKWSK